MPGDLEVVSGNSGAHVDCWPRLVSKMLTVAMSLFRVAKVFEHR
jgi:hypothetical protein